MRPAHRPVKGITMFTTYMDQKYGGNILYQILVIGVGLRGYCTFLRD